MKPTTVSEIERSSLRTVVNMMAQQGTAVPDPTDQQAEDAFFMADNILDALSVMRKSIARDKSIQDAQGLLRISAAALCYTQAVAQRRCDQHRAMVSSADAGLPVAYHCLMVECFGDGTYTVRLENGALGFENGKVTKHGVHGLAPSGSRTADQAAHDVIVGARMLSRAIVGAKITAVD